MPSRRTTARWLCTFATLATLGVLAASLWFHVTIREPNTWRIEVSGGAARINWDTGAPTTTPGPTQYDWGRASTPFELWPRGYRRVGWPGFILPLWTLVLAAGVPTAALWLQRPGHALRCAACGYSRRGLPAGAKCPECGGSPTHSSDGG